MEENHWDISVWFYLENIMIRLPFCTKKHHTINPWQCLSELVCVHWDKEHLAIHKRLLIFSRKIMIIIQHKVVIKRCANIHQPCTGEHISCHPKSNMNSNHQHQWLEILENISNKLRFLSMVNLYDFLVDYWHIFVINHWQVSVLISNLSILCWKWHQNNISLIKIKYKLY